MVGDGEGEEGQQAPAVVRAAAAPAWQDCEGCVAVGSSSGTRVGVRWCHGRGLASVPVAWGGEWMGTAWGIHI